MKKAIKKIVCMTLALLTVAAVMTSCGNAKAAEATAAEPETTVTNPAPSGKFAVHFEGTVTAVDGDRITLDNGKVITVNEDTVYTTPSGAAEKSALRVGDYIQGSTADDPAAAVVSAKRIHIVVF